MNLIGSKRFEQFSKDVFLIDKHIRYFALIDLEGHILVENSKNSKYFVDTDEERLLLYHQIGKRRSKREDFDDLYGETFYVHIQRKKIQQLIVYLPLVTIYLLIDNKAHPNELAILAKKILNFDKKKLNQVLNSILIHENP